MKTAFVLLAPVAFFGSCRTQTQVIKDSPVLSAMVAAGAGNPQQYTREGLNLWFAKHPDVANVVIYQCAPSPTVSDNTPPVTEPERVACAAAVEWDLAKRAWGYVEPTTSGKVW